MAKELYIEKEYKKKDKEGNITPVKTKYRVDADFEPKKPNEVCKEFIENYCISKGKETLQWYIDILSKTEIKDNKEIPITEGAIKKEFIDKFFPVIRESKKATETRNAKIDRLKKLLNDMK